MPYRDPPRLSFHSTGLSFRPRTLLGRILAILAGTLLLAGAVAFSIVLLAVAVMAAAGFGGYLWWKTRGLRKQLRTAANTARYDSGSTIEGEVVREVRTLTTRDPR